MAYFDEPLHNIFEELDTTKSGLSEIESKERLAEYGENTISIKKQPLWRKIIKPFQSVFMAVLLVAALVSVWQHSFIDAGLVVFIMLITAAIDYIQQFSTERVLRALQDQSIPEVEVFRKGERKMMPATILVPGDVIILDEGDAVPADVRIIESRSLYSDESQLTGESLPVLKENTVVESNTPVYEQKNMAFQGSFIVGGSGVALVIATGNSTEFGKLSDLASSNHRTNPVQTKVDKLIVRIIGVVIGVALFAFLLALYRGIALGEALRFVIALSVSAVPENLPVAISVILVFAMRRMAKRKALVRSIGSIESIGAITTIATDKTGTLTRNKLSVHETWSFHNNKSIASAIALSALRSQSKTTDPLDTAFISYANDVKTAEPVKSFTFEHTISMSGNLHHHGKEYILSLKGAPEKVIDYSDLAEGEREEITAQIHHLAGMGYRVIALAHTTLNKQIDSLEKISEISPLTFDGLVGVADTLRPEAKRAIAKAQAAGITVCMVTGDHFETAFHIGKELGLVASRDQVFDSREITLLSDDQLENKLSDIRVFSRVLPEHKHRILEILKRNNITAMTGDGVNDVPALTNADVGVAMGSGSQIAKDASDIILLDNNFNSIISAIHEGRTVFANIKRMVAYLLATNLGEVIVSLGALATGLPLPLTPIQILWINLVTDSALVIPIGLEPGESRNMLEKPKKSDAPLLSKFMISRIVVVAIIIASLTLGVYTIYDIIDGAGYARTLAFCALVTIQWACALEARSDYASLIDRLRTRNSAFIIGLFIAVILQIVALTTPLGSLLRIQTVRWQDLLIVMAIAIIIPILCIETHKWIGRKFFGKRPTLKRFRRRQTL